MAFGAFRLSGINIMGCGRVSLLTIAERTVSHMGLSEILLIMIGCGVAGVDLLAELHRAVLHIYLNQI